MATFAISDVLGAGIPSWFITDTAYGLFITSDHIPTSIRDSKQIMYAEQPVAGREGTPQNPMMIGNDMLSFSVEFIRRTKNGNQEIIDVLETIRSAIKTAGDFLNNVSGSGSAGALDMPQVIYRWGTHRPPLLYSVTHLDLEHDTTYLVTGSGFAQRTRADFELRADTENQLYRAWQIKQQVAAQTFGRARAFGGGSF